MYMRPDFRSPTEKLENQPANTLHFGLLKDGDDIIDEVVASILKLRILTPEDVVEISCHGSTYVQQKFLVTRNERAKLLIRVNLLCVHSLTANGYTSRSSGRSHIVHFRRFTKAINQMRGGL